MKLNDEIETQVQLNALKCSDLDVDVKKLFNKGKVIETNIDTCSSNISTNTNDILALQSQMVTAQSSINSNSNSISSLSSSVTTLEGSVSTLSSNMSALQNSTEQVTVVYDKSSSNSSINKGYTSGIPSNTNVSMDLRDYNYARVYLSVFNDTISNFGAPCAMVLLSLENALSSNHITNAKFNLYANNIVQPKVFDVFVFYDRTNRKIKVDFYFDRSLQTGSKYFIYKVEGVK